MINLVQFLTDQINDWINADRQEKIVSFQILLAGIIFLIIIYAWNTHKQAIFQLKDFIEQGQRNLQNLHETTSTNINQPEPNNVSSNNKKSQ